MEQKEIDRILSQLDMFCKEFKVIQKDIDENGTGKPQARRMLIFTQGFMFFIYYNRAKEKIALMPKKEREKALKKLSVLLECVRQEK